MAIQSGGSGCRSRNRSDSAASEEPLQSALQILCANQESFGFFFARLDQANRGVRRQGREEISLRASGVKFKSAVEFQHALSIL